MNLKNILVISPHPDDETLGAGGTLLRHKSEGDRIFWVNITNVKEEYGFSGQKVKERYKEIEEIISFFGFEDFLDLGLKPAGLSESDIPLIIQKVEGFLKKIKPEVLYVPFYGDAHSDHRIVFQALQPFFKSFRYPFIKKVLMMEIVSETDAQFIYSFKPNYFVDVSNFMDKKLEALKIYKSEVGMHPFPRSLENIKALASYRGSLCGCKYAEAFMLLKEIV